MSDTPMIFHYTPKMRKKLDLPSLPVSDLNTRAHLRWYVHTFRISRVQYILTMNAASLFSVVTYARGILSEFDYLPTFLEELQAHLDDLGLRLIYERVIAPNRSEAILENAVDKSAIAYLNNAARRCERITRHRDISPWHMTKKLNGVPSKNKGFRTPVEVFQSLPVR